MGSVVYDGITEAAHDGEGAHVGDEIVIAESGAAFGDGDFFAAGSSSFFDDLAHLGRREELALLDVDDFARLDGGGDEIGLAAEKSGDLEDVNDGSNGGHLGFGVDIGDDRQIKFGAESRKDVESFVHTEAAEGLVGGAVGFIVTGFEDIINAERAAGFFEGRGDLEAEVFTFDDARARDKREMARGGKRFPDGGVVQHGLVLAAWAAERRGILAGEKHWRRRAIRIQTKVE
jgi:hypothetical protein